MKSKTGFTLIEVVVVIGIIGILTVIIFPSINNVRAKNRDAERISDIATVQLGLSLYYTENGHYPLVLDPSLTPKYFPADALAAPNADPNHQYQYVPLARSSSPAKCTYYHLGVTLESQSGQVDPSDNFSTVKGGDGKPINANGYVYCTGYSGNGIATGTLNYNVHP